MPKSFDEEACAAPRAKRPSRARLTCPTEWLISDNKQSLSFYCFPYTLIQPGGPFVEAACFHFRD